jgi:hypothetical protein
VSGVPIHWTCADCDLVGNTDGTAEKHTKTTGHMTMSGTDPERLANMRESEAYLRAARLALAATRDVREARKAES